ncbi:MAG: MobF family relaxase [Agitococcus sp.]|nr:MobF family relaxase [Agitococcus sp.]
MLTISPTQTAEQSNQYFMKDMDYYLGSCQTLGYFHGKAALIMGLNNTEITPDSYKLHTMLCNGQYGSEQLVTQGAGAKHVAGFDITMADPKDVSIMRGYAQSKNHPLAQKLQIAHDTAVANTLAFIERYAGCRITKNNQTKFTKSGNLIAAAFDHQINRLDEMHFHTHNFIYNMVIDKNGEHRALENFRIFKNQALFHQIWHANLALELHKIALETEIIDYKKGTFAIKNFNPIITDYYSSRSKSIEEAYRLQEEKLGRELTYAEKEPIKRLHRPQKSKRNIDEILLEFSADVEERFGFDTDQLESFFNPAASTVVITKNELNIIITEAAGALNEKKACFSYEDLLKAVLSLTHGNNKTIPIAEIETAIEEHQDLIRFTDKTITTKAFYKLENDIIQKVMQGKNTFSPKFTKNTINEAIYDKGLTIGQQEALTHILTTSDQYIAIQGNAGSGKTFMLKWAKEIASAEIEFHGLAFTGAAADELEKESGIKSTTIHGFLASTPTPNIGNKKKVWIIDEASMVGSKLLNQVIDRALSENVQIVMIGDIKQYQSISAGTIFSDLQHLQAMEFSHMPQVMRQTEESLINAVASINMHLDYTKAFDIIDKYNMVQSIEDDEMRLNAIAAAYLQSNQNETLMISSTNRERNVINHLVRNKMIEAGAISNERQLDTLSAIDMSDIDKLFAQNYALGQVVVANKQGIIGKNGEQGIIVSTDMKANAITIQKEDNTTHTIVLSKSAAMISVFNQRKKQLGIGERILFGRNNKKLNVKNGQIGIVTAISGETITIKKQGKSIAINVNEYPYLDYSYCISDVKAQGKTSKNVIIAAHSQRSSRASFYVQLTRAKKNLQFFINDAAVFRIGIEDEKSKNSTLRKTIQGIKNERRTNHKRTVAANESNNAIGQSNCPEIGANRKAIAEQYNYIGEPQIINRCDLHNAERPFERIGWKLELCRFGGLLEQVNDTNELNSRLYQHTQRQDGDNIGLIFESEISNRTKFPL